MLKLSIYHTTGASTIKMRVGLFISFLLIFFSAKAQDTAYDEMLKTYYKNTVPTIQPADLYKRMLRGDIMHILDTRMKKEFEVSTLPGAQHVGFLSFNVKKISDIKKDELVIVYCTIGVRSESIGEKIQDKGYKNVYNLYGGIIQWVNSGYPLVNAENQKTSDVHVYSKDWGQWLKKGTAVY